MDAITLIKILSFGAAAYMAWTIGANDVANAMGTSVGSKSITLKQAIIIAGFLEFAGAVFVGASVTETVQKGILDPSTLTVEQYIAGMFASILGAAIWLTIATYKELPVSTTHSIVGSIIGFGLLAAGPDAINFSKLFQIVMSWIISPISGAIVAFLIFSLIKKFVFNAKDPLRGAKLLSPFLVGLTITVLVVSAFFKGLKNLNLEKTLEEALLIGAFFGIISGGIVYLYLRHYDWGETSLDAVEKFFGPLQILTACYIAFSHGANDVANAIGPFAGIVSVIDSDLDASLSSAFSGGAKTDVALWILVMGGMFIVIGLSTWGYKVMGTIGEKITDITPTRGFAATFGAATTVLVCSKMGLPVSTSHTLVGAVIGVGVAGGIGGIDLRVIGRIIVSWIVTIPVAAITTIIIYMGAVAIL